MIWLALSCVGPCAGLLLVVVQRVGRHYTAYRLVHNQCLLMQAGTNGYLSINRNTIMRKNANQRHHWARSNEQAARRRKD